MLASQSAARAASQFVIGGFTLAHTVVVETDAALTKPIEAAGVTVVRACGEGLRSRECAGCVDALMLDVLMYRADG